MIYSTGNSEKKGSYSLKYGIVEVVPTVNSDGMYVYCEPKDCETVSDKIETAAALNDDIVRVIKISSVINYMDRESKKAPKDFLKSLLYLYFLWLFHLVLTRPAVVSGSRELMEYGWQTDLIKRC